MGFFFFFFFFLKGEQSRFHNSGFNVEKFSHTKERPDNEPVNGELQLKEPQWPCMLGIGLDDIKE